MNMSFNIRETLHPAVLTCLINCGSVICSPSFPGFQLYNGMGRGVDFLWQCAPD